MTTNEKALRRAIVALVVGTVLVALGAGMIYSAHHKHQRMLVGYEGPYYWEWDTNYLLFGIAASLVGTAVVSASETYRLVTEKK